MAWSTNCKIVGRLKIQPELWTRVESLREQPSRFRCDATLPPNEFIDALNGNTKMLCKGDLRLTKRHEKLFA